jgi:hypothetical protein
MFSSSSSSSSSSSHNRSSSKSFNFSPVYASCTFYITPAEFNLPSATLSGFFTQQRGGGGGGGATNKAGGNSSSSSSSSISSISHLNPISTSAMAPQEGTFPQKAMLLPAVGGTFSGRAPSFLVGTSGGHILKMNLDFKEKYFAPKFMHPTPFVDVEFMHSASMTTGTAGTRNVQMIQVKLS